MQSQVYPDPQTGPEILFPSFDAPVIDYFMPSMWGYHQLEGEPTHEYLFDKPSETSGPYLSDWSAYQPTMDNAYIDFTTSMPSFSVDSSSFSPSPPWTPLPQEPPSPQESRKPPSKPSCRSAIPTLNKPGGKWYCSVCGDAFRNRYECERHIDNVGKRAKCLACGKTVCARKDNRKRHYTQYCKRMDRGKHGGLALEEAFYEFY